jgi:hypothetical protein
MFALSVFLEVRTLTKNQEPPVIVADFNLVRLPADHQRNQVAGALLAHSNRAALEEAHTSNLDAFLELKCESGGKRHRSETSL